MHEFVVRIPQQMGPILKGYRKAQKLSQANLGAIVGLQQKEVSKIETNSTNVSLAQLFKMLSALNLELVLRPRAKSEFETEW